MNKSFDRHPYLKHSPAEPYQAPVVKKKLSFEEWLHKSSFVIPDSTTREWLQDCWKAAQENK